MPIPLLKNHIVLVSRQGLPSLLGASLPGCEPARIHAVVTPPMREYGRLLREALEARGPRCGYKEYVLNESSSQDAVYAVLERIRAACEGETLGINLTGGTKLMALAAAEWAHACELPAFYIDTDGDQVIRVGSNWGYANLPDVLTVSGLLSANGYEMESADTAPVPAGRRDALTRLLRLACTRKGEMALARLNMLAMYARDTLRARDDVPAPDAWPEMMGICRELGMAEESGGEVTFPDEAARSWCNGIWFEEYVRMTLFRLKCAQRIRDFACSVQVHRGQVRNELDALFAVRNRLFTIECKTANMSEKWTAQPERASSVLYKADSLHDRLGGAFARAMLCSVRPLDAQDRNRARDMRVNVVCGRELLSLEDTLVTWSKLA